MAKDEDAHYILFTAFDVIEYVMSIVVTSSGDEFFPATRS